MKIQAQLTLFFPGKAQIENAFQGSGINSSIITLVADFFEGQYGPLSDLKPILADVVDGVNLPLTPLGKQAILDVLHEHLLTCAKIIYLFKLRH